MLDIRLIRENKEEVIKGILRRGKDVSAEVNELYDLDIRRREIIAEVEAMKAEQNAASKSIPILKKEGKDTAEIFARMKEISEQVGQLDGVLKEIEEKIESGILFLPNIPNADVPSGADSEDNVEVKRVGEPTKFDFEPKPHWEIGDALKILDPQTAAKVTGARFHFYKGLGARLERAIINFYLDTHTSRGYTEVFPPFLANRDSMTATGQLPKFEEDMFAVKDTDFFLIPTAEVPVTNMLRQDIVASEELPIKYCAYSACFRAEGGSAGRDTRGLIRQHQFNKVELVKFTSPESSYDELERLTEDAEFVLESLGLPFRRVLLCAGDLGNSSAKTYDLEVWMPSYGRYLEISSCSNFEDYQARRGSIRFKDPETKKTKFVHTLNGSGVAIGRTTAAILENFQCADGSVIVPEALRKYMGGIERLTPNG